MLPDPPGAYQWKSQHPDPLPDDQSSGAWKNNDKDLVPPAHGIVCDRCGHFVRGGRWALHMHQLTSSKCLSASGRLATAREPCVRCGKMIASQDSWAREQHSRHCDANRRRRAASQQPAASGWPGRHRAEDDENKFAPSVQHENWDRYETRSPAANTAEEAWGWSRYADDNATTNHADDSRSWTRNDEGGNCATTWRWRDHYSERNNWNHRWGHITYPQLPLLGGAGWKKVTKACQLPTMVGAGATKAAGKSGLTGPNKTKKTMSWPPATAGAAMTAQIMTGIDEIQQ